VSRAKRDRVPRRRQDALRAFTPPRRCCAASTLPLQGRVGATPWKPVLHRQR
jgi:hypothetical protein